MKEKKYQRIRSKWFHHMGTLRVVKTPTGQIRMRGDHSPNHACIHDSHIREVFIWLGRYLAEKGQLPHHVALGEIAIRAQRVPKDIRSVMAMEVYEGEQT